MTDIHLISFGFKHGLPHKLDLCFDARFLPNPYYVEELRDKTGKDSAVSEFVFKEKAAQLFIDHISNFLIEFIPYYRKSDRPPLTIAIGCTGGRHRSPALLIALAAVLAGQGVYADVEHRDITIV